MLEEIILKNCPAEYFLNCKNYETRCHECKANLKSKYLLYSPINKDINKHPANIVQKSKAVSYSKLGKTKELVVIKNLPFFNPTRGSGSINGDGDASLYLSNIGKLKVEIKCRFKSTSSFLPSLKEYKESYSQNIKLIIIHLVLTHNSYFYLDYKTFITIWTTFLTTFPLLLIHHFQSFSQGIYKFLFTLTSSSPSSSYLFALQELPKITTQSFDNSFGSNFCYIYTNKVGSYVGMSESTFFELIYLYNSITNFKDEKKST